MEYLPNHPDPGLVEDSYLIHEHYGRWLSTQMETSLEPA
jgi:hypothetical protein